MLSPVTNARSVVNTGFVLVLHTSSGMACCENNIKKYIDH